MAAGDGQRSGKSDCVRFGDFELDRAERTLSLGGREIEVQRLPLALLELLVERAGALVTRDEIRARLWPDGTHVDFEHGVNTALKKLRRALGDDARSPRFVETVPGCGYRFAAAVSAAPGAESASLGFGFRSLAAEFAERAALGVPLTRGELAALRDLLDASAAPHAADRAASLPRAA